MPGMGRQAKSLAGAAVSLAKAALAGKTVKASEEEIARRTALCNDCRHMSGNRCALCGCFLKWKRTVEVWHCPDDPPKW